MASAVSALYQSANTGNCLSSQAETACNSIIWAQWNYAQTATSCGSITQGNMVWGSWNSQYASSASNNVTYYANVARQEQQEERRAREAVQVLADEADKKAESILLKHLSEEQRRTYHESRYFELVTRSGRYRLYKGWAGNIARIGEGNVETDRFCIHPTDRIPEADNLLAQKLMLEIEEDRFLKIANRTAGRRAA